MAQVFLRQIMDKALIAAMTSKQAEKEVLKRALVRMHQNKADLLNEFDNHPVTQELDNGAESSSAFLSRGNLFSFIGFETQDKPTDNIREVLKEEIRLQHFPTKRKNRNSVTFKFNVRVPTLKSIWSFTQYPGGWKSGSWANDLESRGISNFEYYVYSMAFQTVPESRSGTGLQKKFNIGGSSPGPIPYIRQLLEDFRKKF